MRLVHTIWKGGENGDKAPARVMKILAVLTALTGVLAIVGGVPWYEPGQ